MCVFQRKSDTTRSLEAPNDLLPASYRTEIDHLTRIRAPDIRDITFLRQELDLQRLNSVFDWLWLAGRPMPPRPIHYQLILGRDILVTEDMGMHLVWTTGRIFIKPIPRFLLDPLFWSDCLSCPSGCPGLRQRENSNQEGVPSCRLGLRAQALGFLLSYTGLISHESDFFIAQEKHLIPKDVEWPSWKRLVSELLDIDNIDCKINQRFLYGELRLDRLNKIYILSGRDVFRGYLPSWQQYGAYFRDNLAWLASATVYIAIVLTAMQVGLATSLSENKAFRSASYGFTIFAILGPLLAAGMILLVFIFTFMDNWFEAVRYKKRRFGRGNRL